MTGVFLLGVLAYAGLPRESNPDVQIPYVLVITPYPGASPVDVERQVTQRIEREIQGVDGLVTLRSTSLEGVSSINAEFASGGDVDAALQKVRDRVERAKPDLPRDAEEPIVQEINFSNFPVLQLNLAGDVGPMVLKQIADQMEDEIEVIPGVLGVDVIGGVEREVQVDVDPERLRLYGLALRDVVAAVQGENVSVPGGSLDLGDQTFSVRVPGEVTDPLAVGDFVIRAPGGLPVFVRDVALVRFGWKDRSSYSRINGRESVTLSVQKRAGANVIETVGAIKELVDERRRSWPESVEVAVMSDESAEIERMIGDLENNILSGLVLVVLVLMFFLGLRNAFFVGLAIPFSMLVTFVVLDLFGLTLNMTVLFGLVLSVGMLVDNAVVVIENIYRYIQEGETPYEAARRGTLEVGGAVTVSTLTTVGAFLPLAFWPGIMGQFMRYMPITVSIALLSSLLVALTVNPVLCAAFLRRDERPEDERKKPLAERLEERFLVPYRRVLERALAHRARVILGTFALFALVLVLFGFFNHGVEFVPETDPSRIWIDVDAPPGTRLERTDERLQELASRLGGLPDVSFLASASGAGSQNDASRPSQIGGNDGGAGDSNVGRLSIELEPLEERTQNSNLTMDEARRQVEGAPGVEIEISRKTQGPPTGDAVALEIYGPDFATLGQLAERIQQKVADIPGVLASDDDFDLARPELRIQVDRTRAARLGISTGVVASTIRTAVNGTEASTFRQGDDDIDITVRLAEAFRDSIEDLEGLTVASNEGQLIPLGEIATVERSVALPAINRKDRQRVVTLTAEVASTRVVGPVREETLRRINADPAFLPHGYSVGWGGQNEMEEEARGFLGWAFLYGVLLVMALILAKFDSFAMPAIISTSVFMSLIGVFLGLLVTGLPFGMIMTSVGVISLAGIVVNNAIVLLDYGEQLVERGFSRSEIVMRTGMRRARPVVLTAVTTILGLIPLSTGYGFDFRNFQFVAGGESSQFWSAMGAAVIFGLGFATFLTLILVPVLYDILLERRERKADREKPHLPRRVPDARVLTAIWPGE